MVTHQTVGSGRLVVHSTRPQHVQFHPHSQRYRSSEINTDINYYVAMETGRLVVHSARPQHV